MTNMPVKMTKGQAEKLRSHIERAELEKMKKDPMFEFDSDEE
jgi:hypothetical protein